MESAAATHDRDPSPADLDRKASVTDEMARSIVATNFAHAEVDGVLEEGSLDPRYRAKATILNAAMQVRSLRNTGS